MQVYSCIRKVLFGVDKSAFRRSKRTWCRLYGKNFKEKEKNIGDVEVCGDKKDEGEGVKDLESMKTRSDYMEKT